MLAPLPGRDARFNQGVALVRARDYRGARAAFKAAVDLDPGDHEAAENLALTDRILAYLDATRAPRTTTRTTPTPRFRMHRPARVAASGSPPTATCPPMQRRNGCGRCRPDRPIS
ncbi:hypothetical protein [Paracoccus yeei]|uniref:hypothetical protein n=1 Tax=Paracoccus yeei TaxID=147645 RepID=UPI003BF8381B